MLGSGSLVGAVFALSSKTIDQSVQRLLRERIDLARTTGILLEDRVLGELSRLVARVRDPLAETDAKKRAAATGAALREASRDSLYHQGAFALDTRGKVVVGVPALPDRVVASVDLGALVRRANRRRAAVVSPLVGIAGTGATALVLLAPVLSRDGAPLGYVAALLEPAATNVLEALARAAREQKVQLDLVDRGGRIVASSSKRELLSDNDHNNVLADAIKARRPLRSRCHSCHERGGAQGTQRTTTVLAFAPLPTLGLGVAVRQPEREALRPAFVLKRRLLALGVVFVALFLLFAGLSVRSVVRPIVRLTRAVRAVREQHQQADLPRFGHDEVGELALAIERFRQEMLDSLAMADRNRAALDRAVETTRRQLGALQRIAEQTVRGARTSTIVEEGLELIADVPGVCAAVLEIGFSDLRFSASHQLDLARARELLEVAEDATLSATLAEDDEAAQRTRYRAIDRSLDGRELVVDGRPLTTLTAARVDAPQHVHVWCWVAGSEPVDARWLRSILQHITATATARLLRYAERRLEEQRVDLLRRVLKAQEEERLRVAHDLHDTLAQDLAALRLEIERLTAHAGESDDERAALERLETQATHLLDSVRGILLDLRLPPLENMGLVATLGWHLERVQREHGLRCTLAVDGEEQALPYERAAPIFRVVQEAVQNVVQHAEASHVFVSVELGDEEVSVTIEDDGKGFDMEATASAPREGGHGLGLLGMRERARLLGGELSISSASGEGTAVTLRAPTRHAAGEV